MRVGHLVVGVVTLIALARPAAAQPFGDPERPDREKADERNERGSGTKIPVTMTDPEIDPSRTDDDVSPPIATSPLTVSLEQPIQPDQYICGPGDVFELAFWGTQNIRLKLAIDLEGRTFIPKVGFVSVAGKTLSAVRTQITKKVRGNYPGLQFDLTLVSPRNFLVHLVDNVKSPGSYRAQPTDRVSTILARAGTLPAGSRRAITVQRKNGTTITADLLLYELTGDTSHNPYLLDGDVVRVPFAELTVSIGGAVRRPGSYELVGTKDVGELLQLAGGLRPTAATTLPIRINRRNVRQQATFTELPYTGTSPGNLALQDDDSVLVRSTEELQRSVLLIGAVLGADTLDAAATSKRLSFVEGDTVLSILDRAGGVRAPGDLSRAYIARPTTVPGQQDFTPLDLEALLVRRDFSADKPIQMGDTIVIPPMRHSILVEGAVARAGLYTYNPRFGIPEYIAHAGGRTRTARDLDEVMLIEPTGVMRSYRSGMKIAPGDAILVPERNFSRAEIVQIVIAATGLVLSGVAITIAATR